MTCYSPFEYEPRHDKTNKVTVRPEETQISLGIRPVWSVPSLCAQWVAKDPMLLHADSEDYDQTGRMPRSESSLGSQDILLVLSCSRSVIQYMSHDMTKPAKWLCAQRRLRSAWASAQSDQSLRGPHEEALGPYLPIKRTAKTRIRLGGCPVWSESSLGAQSLCWFCRVAARIQTGSSRSCDLLSFIW